MDFILDRLALGTWDEAQQLVSTERFTCIINLSERASVTQPSLWQIHLPMPDETWIPRWQWQERLRAIKNGLQNQGIVLVHCRLGVSRSPALVTAWLTRCGWTLTSAREWVTQRHPVTAIHQETWTGLSDWYSGRDQHA